MKPVVVTLALAATFALAGSAHAAMCVKKNGAVVVRDTCRKKETPMSTSDFVGAPGDPGQNGAQGARGEKGDQGDPGGFRLVDSTGKEVGVLSVAHSDTIGVVVPNVGAAIIYSDTEDPSGFWQGDASLFHESIDCTGEPLGELNRYNLLPEIQAFANSAYVPKPPGSTRSIASWEEISTSCSTFVTPRGLCCQNFTTPEDRLVAPVVTVPLQTLGTPPFTVVP